MVALHGFTHTGAQFDRLADAAACTIIAPDLPGHGDSAGHATDPATVVDAVADTVRATGGADAVPVLGYSQGARLAIAVTAAHPDAVSGLVLVSGSPGLDDEAERSARRASDEALAASIRSGGVEAFIDEWTDGGITSTRHRSEDDRRTDRERRLVNTADGLARALTGYGQGVFPSQWSVLPRIAVPVLLVAGERDRRYVDLAASMASSFPHATVAVVEGAGHDVVADRPVSVGSLVSAFLDRLG